MEKLGSLLRSLREEKGYSLREVQNLSGNAVSHGYLHALERGYDTRTGKPIQPSPHVLEVLAKVYDYPYSKLLEAAGYLPAKGNGHDQPQPWWERDEPPGDIELWDFVKEQANLRLMGNPLDEEAKEDILLFLRAAHEHIKREREAKKKRAAETAQEKDEG